MDLFRVLINERPSKLCLIDQHSEEVHKLQSSDKKKLVLLSTLDKRFSVSVMQDFLGTVFPPFWNCALKLSHLIKFYFKDGVKDTCWLIIQSDTNKPLGRPPALP